MGKFNFATFLFLLLLSLSFHLKAVEGGGGGEEKGPQYLPLEPVLVNLEGKRRYLKADVQMLVESKESADKIKAHTPAIRHALIMLLSNRNPEQLTIVEEREKIRKAALEEVTKALEQYDADGGIEDLFFTDFFIQ
jgi:flagellar FliL protein